MKYIFTLYIAQLQAICTNAASEKVRSQTQTEETDFIYYWQQLFVVVVMHLSYVRIIGQYQLGISKRIFFWKEPWFAPQHVKRMNLLFSTFL